jgi:glycosyltransferase involved in cell wall biosynthesis
MARPPKVTVLIPCFNLGEYLAEAVDSVFAQTCQDFEIVIVDDGSTAPETRRILEHFKRPRTTLLRTENRGLAAARNHAIAHARGQYLCALDADDRLHPEFLAKTTARLDADPNLAFVSTWVEIFGAERWIWRQERCDFPLLLSECVVLTASPVRREAVIAVGGYDEAIFPGGAHQGHEDWDLWISLVEKGYRGAILPEVLFHYRRRPGSMSALCLRGRARETMRHRMIEKHRASFGRHAADVLLLRERECGEILRANTDLEMEIARLRDTLAAASSAARARDVAVA